MSQHAPLKDVEKRAAIDRALARDDVPAAARLAVEAVASESAEPIMLNLAAWDREEAFDFAGARVLPDRAAMLAPNDATIITAQDRVERLQGLAGETAAARQSYLRAAALDPGSRSARRDNDPSSGSGAPTTL